MKNLLYISLFLPLLSAAQTYPKQVRGEVYKAYASKPSQDLRATTLEVKKTMYGLKFKDVAIPTLYKNAVATYFKERLNVKKSPGTYRLKIENRQGYIWVEGIKTLPIDAP